RRARPAPARLPTGARGCWPSSRRSRAAPAGKRPSGAFSLAEERRFPIGRRHVTRGRDRCHTNSFARRRNARRRTAGVQACCLLHVRVSAAGRQPLFAWGREVGGGGVGVAGGVALTSVGRGQPGGGPRPT